MSNGSDKHSGRTFWDFVSEGGSWRAFVALVSLISICLGSVLTLSMLGYRIVYRGEPIYLARSATPVFAGFVRLANDEATTVQDDGFVYVECPDDVKGAKVLIEADRVMTSGLVKTGQSAIFPIQRGQKVRLVERDPLTGDVQIRFFRFR